jgi:hypothetical protein
LLAAFVRDEWASWAEEVPRKLREEAELEEWLQRLQQKPSNPAA